MKKLLSLMAALFVSTAAFAGGYKGDFQLNFGAGFDTITTNEKDSGFDVKTKMESGLFTMDFETWHVFGSNDVFKIGFMVGYDFGLGGTMNIEYITPLGSSKLESNERFIAIRTGLFIAPAFSFFIGDVVSFNVAPGLSILLADVVSYIHPISNDLLISGISAVGPGVEVQAKFCPNARVSPVLSYRFTANFTKNISTTNGEVTQKSTCDSIIALTNTFKVGISWNW